MSMKNLFKNFCFVGVASMATLSTAWANNVQVALEGSLLKVVGDNLANDIVIAQNIAGDITVTGRNGTTVNGRPSFRLPRVALNAIEMQMEGGNDVVAVRSLQVANDLYANLGEGNDRFDLLAGTTIGAIAGVEGGIGADTIRVIDSVVGADLFVDGGLDALTATLTRATIGGALTIIGDEAADRVSISETTMADFGTVETKGATTESMYHSSWHSHSRSIPTGRRHRQCFGFDDSRRCRYFHWHGKRSCLLDERDEWQKPKRERRCRSRCRNGRIRFVTADAVFEGGAGVDTYTDLGITAGVKLDVKEFEVLR